MSYRRVVVPRKKFRHVDGWQRLHIAQKTQRTSDHRAVVRLDAQNLANVGRMFRDWYTNASYRGGKALEGYKSHGSGVFLLRAYLEAREAVQKKNEARREKLLITLLTATPLQDKWNAAIQELIMLSILLKLDLIIRDLLTNCEDPGVGDDQLKALRGALRIGRGRSFHDVAQLSRAERSIGYWVTAYRTMHYTGTLKSERAIAKEIAKELGISPRTAFNYWQKEKKARPSIAKYARVVRGRIRRAANSE